MYETSEMDHVFIQRYVYRMVFQISNFTLLSLKSSHIYGHYFRKCTATSFIEASTSNHEIFQSNFNFSFCTGTDAVTLCSPRSALTQSRCVWYCWSWGGHSVLNGILHDVVEGERLKLVSLTRIKLGLELNPTISVKGKRLAYIIITSS